MTSPLDGRNIDEGPCQIKELYSPRICSCFLSSADNFQNQFFFILSGIPSACHTVWIQIRPDVLTCRLHKPDAPYALRMEKMSKFNTRKKRENIFHRNVKRGTFHSA